MAFCNRYSCNTYFSIFRAVAAAYVLLFINTGHAALTLEFSVTENTYDSKLEKVNGKDKSVPVNSTENYVQTVVLGDRRFSVSKGADTTVFDFNNNRITTFNTQNKTYYQRSLFSILAFNIMELKNRQFLSKIMSESGVANNPMGQLPTEHLFSIHNEKNPLSIPSTKSGDWVRLGHKNMPLVRYQPGEKASLFNTKTFVQFLRYTRGGHPVVLEALLKQRTIPKRLEFTSYNMNRKIYDYRLASTKKQKGAFPNIKDFREIAGDKVKVDEIETLIFNNKPLLSKTNSYFNKIIKKAEEHHKNKNYLDSMLGYLEFTLSKGSDLPPSFHKRKLDINNNPQVKQLMGHISPTNKEEAELAVKTLTSLRDHTNKNTRHVLNIFIANINANLGEHEGVRETLLTAIKKNSLLSGAYKDLGDIYHNSYQTNYAWLCWDFARQIEKDHRMLQQINTYEKDLVNNFPDFFL